MLHELGNGSEQSFWRGSTDWDSGTGFHPHCCSADWRTCTFKPDFDAATYATANNDRSTDSDHDQGSRRKYTEHASVTQRSWLDLTNAGNAREQSAGKSIHSDSVPDVSGRVHDRGESEFDQSGFKWSRFNDSEFDQSKFVANGCHLGSRLFSRLGMVASAAATRFFSGRKYIAGIRAKMKNEA